MNLVSFDESCKFWVPSVMKGGGGGGIIASGLGDALSVFHGWH